MKRIFFKLFLLSPLVSFSQLDAINEELILHSKKLTAALGIAVPDTADNIPGHRFQLFGSGLITYVPYDSGIIEVVVTAGHVVKELLKHDKVYIRKEWADTLNITNYIGLPIKFDDFDYSPNYFFHPDDSIDLAAIIIPHYRKTEYYKKIDSISKLKIFPLKQILNPKIGSQVLIFGYPGHIANQTGKFGYLFSTFKEGRVVWVPPVGLKSKVLNHILLIESNAAPGNSGSPVLYLSNDGNLKLAGILVAGYDDYGEVYFQKNKYEHEVIPKLYIKSRAGVSLVETGETVYNFIKYVEKKVKEKFDKMMKSSRD
ncbi:MAG TPA: trypsin-like peptidase domain-containing protein [Candidatus Dojkabacteria bacterium]|nr:trypsin-like peptidase domain-containing protein [Candidatus Dojkabacteria bacterium]